MSDGGRARAGVEPLTRIDRDAMVPPVPPFDLGFSLLRVPTVSVPDRGDAAGEGVRAIGH